MGGLTKPLPPFTLSDSTEEVEPYFRPNGLYDFLTGDDLAGGVGPGPNAPMAGRLADDGDDDERKLLGSGGVVSTVGGEYVSARVSV